MRDIHRYLRTTVALAVFVSTTHLAWGSVASDYVSARQGVDQLQQKIASQIMDSDIDGFLGNYHVSDGGKKELRGWFKQLDQARKQDKLVSVEVDIPLLAATSNRALANQVRFDLHFESSGLKQQGWPVMALERNENRWVIVDANLQELAQVPTAAIKNASFSTTPEMATSSIRVAASFVVKNEADAPLAALPIYVRRHPLNMTQAKLDGKAMVAKDVTFGTINEVPTAMLQVEMQPGLAPGASREVSFEYSVSYAYHDLGRKPVGFTGDRGFVCWEACWYPHFNHDWKMIPYTMSVTVPSGYKAVTCGGLIDRKNGSGSDTYTYKADFDTAPFFVWGRYQETARKMGNKDLVVWTPAAGDLDPKPMMDLVEESAGIFSGMLPPMNLDVQRVIAVTRYGGYGPIGNLLLNDSYFAPSEIAKPETLDFVAHELSHNWVNSISLPTGDPQMFLAEGLATYLGGKVVEKSRGSEAAKRVWSINQASYRGACFRAVCPRELTEIIQNADNQMFRAVAYFKGAFFFREIESIVGEDVLAEALRKIMLSHRGGSFTLDDFLKVVAKLSNIDLSSFNRFYLEGNEVPDYAIEHAGDGEPMQRVVLRNLGAESPVPVEIVAYDASMNKIDSRRVIVGSTKKKAVEFDIRKAIARVVVDPSRRVLQSELRNDVFPDSVPRGADAKMLEAFVIDVVKTVGAQDAEAFDAVLTRDPEKLDPKFRQRLLGALTSGKFIDVIREGPAKVFATGADTAEASVAVNMVLPSMSRHASAEFNLVREGDDWKVAMLVIR